MGGIRAVVFDIGGVLFHWHPRYLYERLIGDDRALDAFLRDVLTMDWHLQHDEGRPFAETSTELIALHPEHEALIAVFQARFNETVKGPMEGMHELVAELDAKGVPLFSITNFSGEFFPPFRDANAHLFDRFRDIVVSGDEKLVKPDQAIYALALDRFGLKPGEAIFIDDRLENVEAADVAGFHGHHFVDAAHLRAALERASLL